MIFLQGCCSIIHGSRQEISISSTPTGANVYNNGELVAVTPAVLDLKRSKTHAIKIEKDGYECYEIATSRQISGWALGNIAIGGLVGPGIDALTGSLYKIEPAIIDAILSSSTGNQKQDGNNSVLQNLMVNPKDDNKDIHNIAASLSDVKNSMTIKYHPQKNTQRFVNP